MNNPGQETLGEYLKKRRTALLTPVHDIAQAVGSEKALIEALEENDYDAFTLRVHALALVKKYAAYLKLDEEEVLKRFEMQWQRYSVQRSFPKLSSYEDASPASPEKPGARRLKLPDIWRLPKITLFPFTFKFRLPILVVVFAAGLFLLIDLPLSKQKPQPPPDPRFSEPAGKAPSALPAPITPNDGKAEAAPEAATKAREDIPPIPQTGRVKRSAEDQIEKVVGNSDTKRYHLPGMKYYHRIKAYHRVVFNSEKEAIKAGYRKARE